MWFTRGSPSDTVADSFTGVSIIERLGGSVKVTLRWPFTDKMFEGKATILVFA
jgi:hypothetical protein